MFRVGCSRQAGIYVSVVLALAGAAMGNGAPAVRVTPTLQDQTSAADATAALRGLAAALKTRPGASVVWSALPPGYRKDLQAFVKMLGDDVDPDLFERSLALVDGWGVVLRGYGEKLLATGDEGVTDASRDRIVALAYQVAGEGLVRLAAGAAAHRDRLGELDLEQVFGEAPSTRNPATGNGPAWPAADALARALGHWGEAEMEVTAVEGEIVTVRIRPAGLEPVDLQLAASAGYCIPLGVARAWPSMAAAAVFIADGLAPASREERAEAEKALAQAQRQLALVKRTPSERHFAKALADLPALGENVLADALVEQRVVVARTDMRLIESLVVIHAIRHGDYPRSLDRLSEDVPLDPWGNPYHYEAPRSLSDSCRIVCYGADGRRGGKGVNADIEHER